MYARLVGIGCLEGDMNGNNINRVVAIENECPGLENLGILALWSSCSVDFSPRTIMWYGIIQDYLSVLISAQCIL